MKKPLGERLSVPSIRVMTDKQGIPSSDSIISTGYRPVFALRNRVQFDHGRHYNPHDRMHRVQGARARRIQS